MNNLELAIQLVNSLKISFYIHQEQYIMSYESNNKMVVALGVTKEEVILNFYELYTNVFNCWKV